MAIPAGNDRSVMRESRMQGQLACPVWRGLGRNGSQQWVGRAPLLPYILHDRLADGRPFKTLSVLDEFTRECVAILVATSIRAVDVIDLLQRVFRKRGAPQFLRSDNGSEFTAQEVQIWLEDHQTGPAFIPPGQPWNNGFIESFHDKFRDECLNREWFQSLSEAQVAIEKWRRHYNTQRPHSALGYQTPAQFAATYQAKR